MGVSVVVNAVTGIRSRRGWDAVGFVFRLWIRGLWSFRWKKMELSSTEGWFLIWLQRRKGLWGSALYFTS